MEAVRRGAKAARPHMPLADSVEVLRIIAAVLAGKPRQSLLEGQNVVRTR